MNIFYFLKVYFDKKSFRLISCLPPFLTAFAFNFSCRRKNRVHVCLIHLQFISWFDHSHCCYFVVNHLTDLRKHSDDGIKNSIKKTLVARLTFHFFQTSSSRYKMSWTFSFSKYSHKKCLVIKNQIRTPKNSLVNSIIFNNVTKQRKQFRDKTIITLHLRNLKSIVLKKYEKSKLSLQRTLKNADDWLTNFCKYCTSRNLFLNFRREMHECDSTRMQNYLL